MKCLRLSLMIVRILLCVFFLFPYLNLASFFVAFVCLGHRQYSDQIIVRFDDVLVRDGIPVPSLKAPLNYRSFEEDQNHGDDQGNN